MTTHRYGRLGLLTSEGAMDGMTLVGHFMRRRSGTYKRSRGSGGRRFGNPTVSPAAVRHYHHGHNTQNSVTQRP